MIKNVLYRNKKVYFLVLLIIGIFALFRLPNLTLQPIFVDEAIYIRWAQIMRAEPTLRFVSLQDGKTPLFMWSMIPLLKVVDDPLYAGRILSVISGFFTMIGVFILGWRFFNLKVGIAGAFLIAITPFMVFFDRLALVDSMLSAFTLWSLLTCLFLIQSPRVDLSMFLGFFIGGSILTKTPGFFNILCLPFLLLTFDRTAKERSLRLLKIFALIVYALIISMAIYGLLKLGPGFENLSSRNQDYIHTPDKLIENPLNPLIPHLYDVYDWFVKYLGWPVILFFIGGSVWGLYKRNIYIIALLFWAGIPIILESALIKAFTARYILFAIPPLILIASWSFVLLWEYLFNKRIFKLAILLTILIWPFYFNLLLLFKPESTPLPKNERRGYFEDWTAGYGLKEIANYLDEQSKKELIVVGTEGYFGTLPDGLQIYLDKNRQVVIIGGRATISAELKQASKDHPAYFVANKSRFSVTSPGVKLIKEYPKVENPENLYPQDSMLLFEVIKESSSSPDIQK